MPILLTGGAGYIGSVTLAALVQRSEPVVVLDNLSRGNRGAIGTNVCFYNGDVGDSDLVQRIVRKHGIDSCIHFAAYAYVDESVKNPRLYFENNVNQGIRLLQVLIETGVSRFVFSSSCATYGEPRFLPISEEHPQYPSSPYGWSKLIMERALESYSAPYGLQFVALRFFNAAGATGTHGEYHVPETHLIPNALAAACGRREYLSIFGSEYPTPDGTAMRDYIHVTDLAHAHILALDYLHRGGKSDFFNLGTGMGHSVLEVMQTVMRITGLPVNIKMQPTRVGDASRMVASCDRAREILGWEPRNSGLEQIIGSAWEWSQQHPAGYPESTRS